MLLFTSNQKILESLWDKHRRRLVSPFCQKYFQISFFLNKITIFTFLFFNVPYSHNYIFPSLTNIFYSFTKYMYHWFQYLFHTEQLTTDCNIAIVCFNITMEWGKKGKRDKEIAFCLTTQGTGFTSPCFKYLVLKEERSTVVNIKVSFHAKQLRYNKDQGRLQR